MRHVSAEEPAAATPRPIQMRLLPSCLVVLALTLPAGCGDEAAPTATPSGVSGRVHLGPQCPVERVDMPCDERSAAGVVVTVHVPLRGQSVTAGKEVARGTTDGAGRFRIEVTSGEYVVTADAGMSCDLAAARVAEGSFATVDVMCDTGIR